jgi:hypothetical protein
MQRDFDEEGGGLHREAAGVIGISAKTCCKIATPGVL